MDGEIAKNMLTILKKQGLDFSLSTKVVGGSVTASGVTVNLESVKGDKL
jgi:dihydrolipoamide dehydrogenase